MHWPSLGRAQHDVDDLVDVAHVDYGVALGDIGSPIVVVGTVGAQHNVNQDVDVAHIDLSIQVDITLDGWRQFAIPHNVGRTALPIDGVVQLHPDAVSEKRLLPLNAITELSPLEVNLAIRRPEEVRAAEGVRNLGGRFGEIGLAGFACAGIDKREVFGQESDQLVIVGVEAIRQLLRI